MHLCVYNICTPTIDDIYHFNILFAVIIINNTGWNTRCNNIGSTILNVLYIVVKLIKLYIAYENKMRICVRPCKIAYIILEYIQLFLEDEMKIKKYQW